MARKEIENMQGRDEKKMQTRDLIYAGAFGAIYLVVMLAVVMVSGMVPVLYLVAPLTVGVVCGDPLYHSKERQDGCLLCPASL